MVEDSREGHEAQIDASDLLSGDTETVSTSYGPITATFVGKRSKSACIAYPEAGLSRHVSFQSLVAASGTQSLLLKHFCLVFLDLPGCETPESTVPETLKPITLGKLAGQLAEVVAALNIKDCLGIGIGTGGYVLAKCAAENPKIFAGLILVSPACRVAGWWEWGAGKLAIGQMRLRGWTGSTTGHFAARAFSSSTLQLLGGDSDLVKGFSRDLKRVPASSAILYLEAAIGRKSIVDLISHIKCRVLLLYGVDSPYYGDSLDFASKIDKSKFALVEYLHAGTLLTQERPADLLSPMKLFLTALQMEGIGLDIGSMIGE